MEAFSNQQQPLILDFSYMLNNSSFDTKITMPQEHHFSDFIVDPDSNSEPHHTVHDHNTGSKFTFSDREPFITDKHSDETSAVLEELQNCDDQVSKNVISMEKNKKGRRASPSSSTKSKDASAIQRRGNKKPKKSNAPMHGDETKVPQEPPKGYIHVRARRGEATDSHSIAERVRREKISERMRMLQKLVPGCDKVTGKALMLDQIISYVQSLQNQVELLSMKLASLNPTFFDFTFDLNKFLAADENQLDSFASQVPTVQLCSSSQPAAFVDAQTVAAPDTTISCVAKAVAFHPVNNDDCNLLSNPHSVLHQGLSTHVFPQDCVSLYLDMEDTRQTFLTPCDFAATYVPSIDGMGHIDPYQTVSSPCYR